MGGCGEGDPVCEMCVEVTWCYYVCVRACVYHTWSVSTAVLFPAFAEEVDE